MARAKARAQPQPRARARAKARITASAHTYIVDKYVHEDLFLEQRRVVLLLALPSQEPHPLLQLQEAGRNGLLQ